MQHEHPKKSDRSREADAPQAAGGHRPAPSGEPGGAGLPRYLQRQPLEEEEEELQAKLTVGAPNDRYEQQADRVADQVMRMPGADLQRQPEEEEEEEELLQPKPLSESILRRD